jgi:hypothetical protein
LVSRSSEKSLRRVDAAFAIAIQISISKLIMKKFTFTLLNLRLPQGCQIQLWHPDSPDSIHPTKAAMSKDKPPPNHKKQQC